MQEALTDAVVYVGVVEGVGSLGGGRGWLIFMCYRTVISSWTSCSFSDIPCRTQHHRRSRPRTKRSADASEKSGSAAEDPPSSQAGDGTGCSGTPDAPTIGAMGNDVSPSSDEPRRQNPYRVQIRVALEAQLADEANGVVRRLAVVGLEV